MRTSEKLGELVAALAKAKAAIKPPKKGKTADIPTKSGGKFSYSYADRADVIEAYQKPLADNGLQIVHAVTWEDNLTFLDSRLLHDSGQWIESRIPIPQVHDAQPFGSFMTYFERYNSCALLDIAAEDDDDGQRAVAPRREEAADPTSLPFYDLRIAIQDAAAELEQRGGGLASTHIRRASEFQTKDKPPKTLFFDDPFARNVTEKWAKGVLRNLQDKLIESEPGVEEGAAVLS